MNRRDFLKVLPVIPLAAAVPLVAGEREFTAGKYVVRVSDQYTPKNFAQIGNAVQEWVDSKEQKVLLVPDGVEILRA